MIEAGGTVPLNLQLYDGREDLRVVATVLDPNLKQIDQVELLHLQGGLYVNRSVLMPSVQYLIANYVVFDGDVESEDYERSSDVFYLLPQTPDIAGIIKPIMDEHAPIKTDFMVGQIDQVFQKDDFIEGKIINHDGT